MGARPSRAVSFVARPRARARARAAARRARERLVREPFGHGRRNHVALKDPWQCRLRFLPVQDQMRAVDLLFRRRLERLLLRKSESSSQPLAYLPLRNVENEGVGNRNVWSSRLYKSP